MKKIGFALGLIVACLFVFSVAYAASPDVIVGKWLNGKQTAHVETYKSGGKYHGKIVWLKEPVYPADDKKGMAGKQKVDRENPDASKRSQPILGLGILRDFTFVKDGLWENGMIYDPENGKDYKCKMTLESPDILNVRGYIGISLIGRTDTWTRVK
ncbi:MAG: DUF2147 domain-containing protein [Syntrophales bacterium]|nr:DUF2147 domain-containing protein [Syntrophales bacterium]